MIRCSTLNNFGIFILCFILICEGKAEIIYHGYELSQQEVDCNLYRTYYKQQNATVTVTLEVFSAIPIAFIYATIETANGHKILDVRKKIYKKKSGLQSLNFEMIIDSWGGDGQHILQDIVFETTEQEKLQIEQKISVNVKGTLNPGPPAIIEGYEALASVQSPSMMNTVLKVKTQSPIIMSCVLIVDPDKEIFVEECIEQFIYWIGFEDITLSKSYRLSKCDKQGKYTFTFQVKNKSQILSNKISFEVDVTSPECWSNNALPSLELKEVKTNIPENKISSAGRVDITVTVFSTSEIIFAYGQIYPAGQDFQKNIFKQQPFGSKTVVEKSEIIGDPTRRALKFLIASCNIDYWSPRGIYEIHTLNIMNEQNILSHTNTFDIFEIEYPKAPWVEIVLEIKGKTNDWKEKLGKLIDEFLTEKQLKEQTEVFMEDKDESNQTFTISPNPMLSSSSQIQLFLGKLQEKSFKEITLNKNFFSALQKDLITSASVTSSDQFVDKRTSSKHGPMCIGILSSTRLVSISASLLLIFILMF